MDDKGGLAATLNNIGLAYQYLNDYLNSIEYFSKALKMNEQTGNTYFMVLNHGGLASVYTLQEKYVQSLEHSFKGLKLSEKLGDKSGMGYLSATIGGVYAMMAKKEDKSALNALFNGDKNKALEKAKEYFESIIVLDKEIGDLYSACQDYLSLTDIQTMLNDHAGALDSYKNYSNLKDSVFNIEKDRKLTQTAMEYEFGKKEAAAKAEQHKKDIKQRNLRNTIAGGLISALFFLAVVFRQRNKISKEKQKSDELLLNILPAKVEEELKKTGSSKAKQFNNVSVIFTDFVNFTGISEQLNPQELVSEIHENFMAFDTIIEKHGLEKIKTIGDAYLAVCGLPHEHPDHAQRVVKAALDIRNYIAERKGKFQIRIGVNSGSVVAGIVGIKKYAYDIWGDTVNTAHRLESSGEPDKINISHSIYELIKDDFRFEYRSKIKVKGKGEIDMYFVEG
ncbi:MAG: tetratricopeptide repeat protein [Bacteroidetes bacterium]|nr:tetratricopeptide repeat protein [Bacteroidota bacterium]